MTTIQSPVPAAGAPAGQADPGSSFVEPLVARLHAQYGTDPGLIRTLAGELLAGFADARVQAFIPVLVEKRLREICRA